eukprot:SAG31_NODE_9578_length_1256_cov_1.511668_2_plen_181_part_00
MQKRLAEEAEKKKTALVERQARNKKKEMERAQKTRLREESRAKVIEELARQKERKEADIEKKKRSLEEMEAIRAEESKLRFEEKRRNIERAKRAERYVNNLRLYEQDQKDRKSSHTLKQRHIMMNERRRLTEDFSIKKEAMKNRLSLSLSQVGSEHLCRLSCPFDLVEILRCSHIWDQLH